MRPVGMAAHVDSFYARSFLDDDSRRPACLDFRRSAVLAALTTPIDVPHLEMTIAIDAIQYLSRRSAAQVL
jgi:hypothetical protein